MVKQNGLMMMLDSGFTIFIKCDHSDEYILYTYDIFRKRFTDSYRDDEFCFELVANKIQ